mgnify:CR=1 FL=1
MAVTTKLDLLAVLETEWCKLFALIDTVPEDTRLAKDASGVSIKDILGHRAVWIDLFLGWIAQSEAGAPVHMPAQGYKWNDLARLNASIRADQTDLDWTDAVALLEDRKQALVAALTAVLYAAPMSGGNGRWTLGRYAEAAGPSHFRSAAKVIRARMKASG